MKIRGGVSCLFEDGKVIPNRNSRCRPGNYAKEANLVIEGLCYGK